MDKVKAYLKFRVGRELYGVNVEYVIEVLHLMALDALPAAAPDVLGLMTLRDTIMPVIDLRLRFGLPDAPLHVSTPIVAVQTANGPLGIVVDDADDVELVTKTQVGNGAQSPYVIGVARLSDQLLLLLDTTLLHPDTLAPISG